MSQIARRSPLRGVRLASQAVHGMLAGIYFGIRRWQCRRATYRLLQALDDRSLKDIGLSRSEVERIAWDVRCD